MNRRLLFSLLLPLFIALNAQAQVVAPKATPKPANDPDCGCESQKALPPVVATVNDVRISIADLASTQSSVSILQRKVVEARQKELDLQINSLLLEAEAVKRQTTVTNLLETEIIAKTVAPTEAEMLAFYNENKARITADFPSVKEQIVAYLKEQQQQGLAQRFADRLRTAAKIVLSGTAVTPPVTAQDRTRVFATVNGKQITSADIEQSLQSLIFAVQEEVYGVRTRAVDMRVNDLLLEREAAKRGVTTKALLEVELQKPVVSDAEAEKFFNENKERITGAFTQVKPQVIQYLEERKQREAEQNFADRLRGAARIQLFLVAPTPPSFNIAVDDQPSKGNPNAATTVVVFTDFQCPSCASQHPVLERLINEFGNRVKFVMRDFPLTQHKEALTAAVAAEAAREQGKYWEYIAILFSNQSALQKEQLQSYATQLNLDRVRFDRDLASQRLQDKVMRDLTDGQKIGVNGTPIIFVNGRRITDRTYEGLHTVISATFK